MPRQIRFRGIGKPLPRAARGEAAQNSTGNYRSLVSAKHAISSAFRT